jgi:cold shock CspA family protein
MAETWNKKEREKKKQQNKKEKAEKKQERKESTKDGNDLDSMMAYIDENGNLSTTPPDPRKRIVIKAENIEIGVPKHEFNPDDLIRTGTITFFNTEKGYGFIKDLASQESVFVHANALGGELVKENNKVTFEVEMGPKGANAINVKLVK